MLFNSHLFIFVFFPLALVGYWLIYRLKRPSLIFSYLIVASLLFYGWYNPWYVLLIVGSILFNYTLGKVLAGRESPGSRKLALIAGIVINLLLLGYFKYLNFFVSNVNTVFSTDFHLNTIILPLAISFFTLQQITYLVDIYRNETSEHSFPAYCLFVSFFPKLIAGPIVRFKEMMPQMIKDNLPRITPDTIAIGLTVFFIGLLKKVILADSLGGYADPVFDAAASGLGVSFFNSWSGALAYTFQLYFDFSGYCDMAIGLGLMLGIRLPLNFYSPYKATSIRDFWRRWHMTLSRFIRDYMYIPLGGNRKGLPRQCTNLIIVMLIAGLWHGAGWTFIVWGGLHGVYLAVYHTWRRLRQKLGHDLEKGSRLGTGISVFITLIAVAVAWVFFRADSLSAALTILQGMVGMNGFVLSPGFHYAFGVFGEFLERIGITFAPLAGFSYKAILWILASLFICWFLPNAQEYMSDYQPSSDSYAGEVKPSGRQWLRWRPSLRGAIAISGVTVTAILRLTQVREFIYFQF